MNLLLVENQLNVRYGLPVAKSIAAKKVSLQKFQAKARKYRAVIKKLPLWEADEFAKTAWLLPEAGLLSIYPKGFLDNAERHENARRVADIFIAATGMEFQKQKPDEQQDIAIRGVFEGLKIEINYFDHCEREIIPDSGRMVYGYRCKGADDLGSRANEKPNT